VVVEAVVVCSAMREQNGLPRKSNKGKNRVPISALIQVASVAAGVQFGWALQLSLLTPYVQELGIPHAWASLIWLCGPISGMFVQPIVGHYSDGCTSRYGRRRPFIVAGATSIVLGILTIGFSADLGFLLGDTLVSRPRAIFVFVLGFWILDLANNVLQGPCRALLADFTGKDQRRTRRANAFFSLFMALGNVLGYATGAYSGWWRIFPFTVTSACNVACANLKAAFLLGIMLLAFTTFLSVTAASEIPYVPVRRYSSGRLPSFTPLLADRQIASANSASDRGGKSSSSSTAASVSGSTVVQNYHQQVAAAEEGGGGEEEEGEGLIEVESEAMLFELIGALRDLPRSMWYILLVTALTWIAWFPFLLFDTDWMGREVFRGEPSSLDPLVSKRYYDGVHMGSLGLMLNSLVLGLFSLCIDFLCRKLGSKYVWGLANLVMAACFAGTAVITAIAKRTATPADEAPVPIVTYAALAVFAILGVPLAVTFSVPYSLTATFTEKVGGGQGLSMGVLNLSVVLPQIVVSLGAGSWDEIFGGGNMPAFLLAAGAAFCGSIAAVLVLPRPPSDPRSSNRVLLGHSSPIP
jgi:solute carrier family 45 protein 1/2/4